MDTKKADVRHVISKLTAHSEANQVIAVEEHLNENPPGSFHTVADQYIGSTRQVLDLLRNSFPIGTAIRDNLTEFISISDVEFGDEEAEVVDTIEKPKRQAKKSNGKK